MFWKKALIVLFSLTILVNLYCVLEYQRVFLNNSVQQTYVKHRGAKVWERNPLSLPEGQVQDNEIKDFLLVLVLSAPGNLQQRNAVRKTWKNSLTTLGKVFRVKFVIGSLSLNKETEKTLEEESRRYKDMVLLDHLADSYDNLSLKVLEMFKWADKNANFSYLLKTDDDCFVRLDVIESELKQRISSKPLYWGSFKTGKPHTTGKWKEENWELGDTYLPHAYGSGYVISYQLVHKISLVSDGLMLYHNEDVSVGAWVGPYIVERKTDPRFHPCDMFCKSDSLVYHPYDSEEMMKAQERLEDTGSVCTSHWTPSFKCYNIL